MRNLIIITTSSKEIMETIIFFKNLQNWRYLGKTGDWEVKARVSLEVLEEIEHSCELTNLIANNQLLKLFREPILTNVLIWMIVV